MLLNKSEKNYYILFFCLAVGMIAFYIDPIQELDLYRYFKQMDYMSQFNFMEFINIYAFKPELLSSLVFFFISKIGHYGLLSMIATTVSYYLIIKCILDYANKKNMRLIEKVIILLFVLSVMIFTHFATRIRNNVAVVICAYAFYREYVKGKNNLLTMFLYILPCFIHTSMLIGVIIRLLLFLKEKYLRLVIIIVMLILVVGTMYITALGDMISNFAMFSSYDTKISVYILNGTEYEPTNVKVKFIFMAFILLNTIYMMKKYNYKKDNPNYTKMILAIDLIVISLVQYNDVFLRFFYLAFFVNIKLFIDTIKLLKLKEEKIIYYAIIILFTLAHLKLQKSSMADLRFPEFADNIIVSTFEFFMKLIT